MLSDREYSRRVRLVGALVVIVLVLVVGAAVVVVRVRDVRQARAALLSVMVQEFEGDRPGAVPWGRLPGLLFLVFRILMFGLLTLFLLSVLRV